MIGRGSRNVDDLATHCFNKLGILTLRVNDDNICIAGQDLIHDLTLCGEGLTTTRYAEDELIAVQELLTVSNNHVLADYVLSVIDTVLVVNVLHTERNKHGERFRCQRSECVNPSYTERHCGVQAVHLLEFQNCKLAQVLSCSREERLRVIVELFLRIGGMNQRKNCEHHSLISRGQIVKKLLHFILLLFHVIRHSCREVGSPPHARLRRWEPAQHQSTSSNCG